MPSLLVNELGKTLATPGEVHVLTGKTEDRDYALGLARGLLRPSCEVGLVSLESVELPSARVVAATAASTCFLYLRQQVRDPGLARATQERLRRARAIVFRLSAEERSSPCIVRDCSGSTMPAGECRDLASMGIGDLLSMYAHVIEVGN